MKNIDGYLRTRLRMCIWKQWKLPRNRVKQLRKCGLPKWEAKAYGNTRKACMRCASSFLRQALPKAIFDKANLVSLLDYYQLVHNF